MTQIFNFSDPICQFLLLHLIILIRNIQDLVDFVLEAIIFDKTPQI